MAEGKRPQFEEGEEVEIIHKKEGSYLSDFVSGAAFAGFSQDGLVRLQFFKERHEITSEKFKITESTEGQATGELGSPDIQPYRVEVAELAMSPEAARQIRDLLNRNIPE